VRITALAFRVALALTLTATPAAAQFTAVVQAPKARPAATADAAQATPGARSDSAGRTALTDMRAWVDSAAGVIAPDSTARADSTHRDSSVVVTSSAGDVAPTPPPAARDAGDGTRAPDTATMLPAIAIAGLAMLAAGAWLLRRSSRA
jgi:LPXTG-motif cell wall-anchored protein